MNRRQRVARVICAASVIVAATCASCATGVTAGSDSTSDSTVSSASSSLESLFETTSAYPSTVQTSIPGLPGFKTTPAVGEVDYPDTRTVLKPFTGTVPEGAISADRAYQDIYRDGMFLPDIAQTDGEMSASLYLFYNNGHGQQQTNGSITLDYQGTLSWVFTTQLNSSFTPGDTDIPRPPVSSGVTATTTVADTPRKCVYVVVVDALKDTSVTASSECSDE